MNSLRVARKDHPLKIKARAVFDKAKRNGEIPPIADFSCVDCGEPAQGYDHRDYSKPLEVEPVCTGCNVRRGSGKYSFVPEKKKRWIDLSIIACGKNRSVDEQEVWARAMECYLDVYYPDWRERRVKWGIDTAEDLLVSNEYIEEHWHDLQPEPIEVVK